MMGLTWLETLLITIGYFALCYGLLRLVSRRQPKSTPLDLPEEPVEVEEESQDLF